MMGLVLGSRDSKIKIWDNKLKIIYGIPNMATDAFQSNKKER